MMIRVASGQSQRLDGIIFVEHHLAPQFGVIFSLCWWSIFMKPDSCALLLEAREEAKTH